MARPAEAGSQPAAFEAGFLANLKWNAAASRASADVGFKARVVEGKVVVDVSDSDGFLRSILPQNGINLDFDFELGWTAQRGFFLSDSAGLEMARPIGIALGPASLQTLYLLVGALPGGLTLELGLDMTATTGPVSATISRMGVALAARYVRGNLAVADLDVDFKPPSGVGLTIDAAGVSGGGFLRFDPDQGQYSGAVELTLEGGIAVKGLGLIATRLPGGAHGYSLLIVITAEGFEPIPLPLGFRLTGIGGLLALNRTFDEAVLRAGLKNHTLESVLFPKDPVRNAPALLATLDKVFPPAQGHHLFGPVARLEWGTPTLITADIALILELGARLRLLILAQLAAILPKPDQDLVRLQMDAVGVLDFDQGSAALDAALFDSRLVKKFVLTGDMALRLNWHGAPNLALAVGGLHPAFNPPPNFPKLARIAINLAAGDNPRIRCEAYFALTSNTVQFGARAELYAEALGFSIQGEIGFDVLLQLAPFQFLADFFAQVQLKRGSSNLFKVRVEGALAGPRPLHVKAKATFEILWWDVTFRIDHTLVAGVPPPLPAPVDVLPQLLAALADAGNWVVRLPRDQRPLVTLRSRPATAAEAPLHPLGMLTVKQTVVPLNMDIARFGQAAPAGVRRFEVRHVRLAGHAQPLAAARDFFAPAQFFELSDADKLSQPSFDSLPAGVEIALGELAFDVAACVQTPAIQFETKILGQPPPANGHAPQQPPYEPEGRAAGRAGAFRGGRDQRPAAQRPGQIPHGGGQAPGRERGLEPRGRGGPGGAGCDWRRWPAAELLGGRAGPGPTAAGRAGQSRRPEDSTLPVGSTGELVRVSNMGVTTANYVFFPSVRQGAAAGIQTPDGLGAAPQPGVVTVPVSLQVNDAPPIARNIRLYGPGDVTGIDPQQVIRTEPTNQAADFEPNYFPLIEFDRPDFPWLFTPAKAGDNGKLRPWLCLVTVRKQNGVSLNSDRSRPLPVLEIDASVPPQAELPNLSESWAWAHAQVIGSALTPPDLTNALLGNPALTLSRLLSPRRLDPFTDYLACVVPAFELGRKAGLGLPFDPGEEDKLDPAWKFGAATSSSVTLPVYYHWEFHTGAGEDFEGLADRLKPRPVPEEAGKRPMDISQPGFAATGLPPGLTLQLEGALRAFEAPSGDWPDEQTRLKFQEPLRNNP